MHKIMFVCLGNICRSPMAEFVFKDIVKKEGVEKNYKIESRATSKGEIGNDIYGEIKQKLNEKNIPFESRQATRIEPEDYQKYDYIIGMEESNIRNIKRIVGEDPDNKIYRLLDFSENPRNIEDPWFTRDFDIAFSDIEEGCTALFKYLNNK